MGDIKFDKILGAVRESDVSGAGTGDVLSPAAADSGNIAVFGATKEQLEDGGVNISEIETKFEDDGVGYIKPKDGNKIKIDNIEGVNGIPTIAASIDNAIVLFDGLTGDAVQDSEITITTTLGADDTTVPTSKAVKDEIPTSMTDLDDVDSISPIESGQIPVWNNTLSKYYPSRNIENFKKYNGIDRSLTYDCFPAAKEITTNSFTLEAGTELVTYYYRGTKVIVNTDKTATLDDGAGGSTAGVYYVYFNGSTGNILATKAFPGIDCDSNPLIAMIKWNGIDYGAILDERHAFDRDCEWHKWSHETVGARYKSGLNLTITGTDHTATFVVSTGIIYDEDIKFIIPETTTMRILARTGATSYEIITTDSTIPFSFGVNNRPNYVRLDTYALTEVASANNRFINFFVYGTNDIKTGIYGFVEEFATTTTGHATIAGARAIGFPNLTGFNLTPELRPLYRIIIECNTEIQPLTASDDYRTVTSLPQGAGTVSLSAANTSFNPYLDITGTNVQTAVEQVYDFYKVSVYTSATIPSLQAGQEVDYVVDEFNNTYRYKVLTDTLALETPYTHPAKFKKISPAHNVLEGKGIYLTANALTSYTYNAVTYEVAGVKYLATTNVNATSGGIRVFNTTTRQQIASIAFNGCKYIVFNPYNNRLYASNGTTTINHYSYLGADPKTLTTLAVAGTTILSYTKMIVVNQGDYGTLVLATNDDGSLEGGGSPGVPPNITHHVWRLVLTQADNYSSGLYVKIWNRTSTNVYDVTFETSTNTALFCFAPSNRKALAKIVIDANLATNSPTLITTLTNNNSYSLTNYNGYAYVNGDLGIDKVLISTMVPASIDYFNATWIYTGINESSRIEYVPSLNKIVMIRFILHPTAVIQSLGILYFLDPSNLSNFYTYNLYDNGFSFFSGVDSVDNCIIVNNGINNFVQKLKF